MIEIIENSVQLALLAVLTVVTAVLSVRDKRTEGGLLAMFYGSYALGDLYWLLYLVYYGHTPRVFYIPDLSWYASYVFLDLVMVRMAPSEERKDRRPAFWLTALFPAAMFLYYVQFGDVAGNVISAVLMGLLIFHAVRGLVFLRTHPEGKPRRTLYIAALGFCLMEYCAWTASCLFEGETLSNPYYWCDFLITLSAMLLFPAYRKAVRT